MLALLSCLVGVLGILLVAEALWRGKLLKYEYHRKFVHMGVGTFAAFWPWLISWHWIQLLGVAMAVVVMIDRQIRVFHFSFRINRQTYGDILFALAITACALLTDVKIFYTLAILHLSVGDGVAALVGGRWGSHWRYKVWGQVKTVIGSMAFWIVSIFILGIGLLFSPVSPHHYLLLIIALPPALTFLENLAVFGLDNVAVSIAVVIVLRWLA